ncbi:ISAs1 family transposase, partial [Porphyromonas gingivalis]
IALFFLERLKSTSKRSFNALQKINALRKPSQILSSDF